MPQTDGRRTDEFWCHELCWHSQAELKSVKPSNFFSGGRLLSGGGDRWNLALMITDRRNILKASITHKRWKMTMWLLLNINRNSYMGSPKAPLDLTLSDLERCKVTQILKPYIAWRRRVRPCFTIKIKGKHIWGVLGHHHIWPWVTLKLERSKSLRFESLISRKGAE